MKTQTDARRLPRFIAPLAEAFGAYGKQGLVESWNPGLTVSGLRRSVIYRPLAVAMALLLLLPMLSWIGGNLKSHRPFQASAQIIGGCTGRGNKIIQNVCAGGVVYASDLDQLESDAVNAYLGLHHLPAADAHVIYDFGRQDLRNAIRAQMSALMLGIINKPPSLRTTHEINLYNWLQALVKQNEIVQYTYAVNEFAKWQKDPCLFTLDPSVASTYGLSYDGGPFCFGGSLGGVLDGTQYVPAASYFAAYGLKKSYGAPAEQFPYFGSIVAASGADLGEVAGIATAAGAIVIIGASAALAASLSASLAAFDAGVLLSGTATTAGFAFASSTFVVSSSTVGSLGIGSILAGPAVILVIALAIGVEAGMRAFTNESSLNDLNNLTATLTQVTNTNPDLYALATDSSGVGSYKLQTALVGQTMPDVPSTAPLPLHQAGTDWNFELQNTNISTLDYQDWDNNTWTAQTWGGWFVQKCFSANNSCLQTDSIIGTIRYLDWYNTNPLFPFMSVKWQGSRIGDKFVSTQVSPIGGVIPCPADPYTGITANLGAGSNFSFCESYASNNIKLLDAANNKVTVSLSPLFPPAFTSPASLPFTPGVASTQTITASGNQNPGICWVSGVLPAGFSLNGGACGSGSFQLTFNGDAATPNGNYPLTLAALNTVGEVKQTFTINVDQHLGITSPALLTGTAGMPVNFLVTTTGNPAPKLSLDPLISLFGLTFKDNGNGTATIGGTATVGYSFLGCSPTPCGITASNSQGTVVQPFGITMAAPPAASLAPPTEAQFTAGLSNSIDVTFTGAVTPVTWLFQAPTNAPWLSLVNDVFRGTTTLKGTPPIGTSGAFTFPLTPVAAGSLPNPDQNFTLNVVTRPVFSSPNTATFTAGTPATFAISANVGTIGLVGTLPKGLSFTGGSSASLSGTPAAGTGGQYPVTLTDDAGSFGSTTQSLLLNVYEASKITSSNSATFFAGMPGSFAVTTAGFPSVSSQPVPQNPLPPTDPNQGKGMYFTVTGLPSTLKFSNLNPQGLATGTLTIQGTPSAADAGVHQAQITAQNGVGLTAQQTLTLAIVNITGPAPASGATCNGNYNGTFTGNINVAAGQNCAFVGGTVNGNIAANAGSLALTNVKITGNVAIQGGAAFSIGRGTTITGNLTVQNVASGSSTSQICGASVNGNAQFSTNASAMQIGSPDVSCLGNSFGGNLAIQDNTAPTKVFNNVVEKNLSCSGNSSISGGGNIAQKKGGQCSAF